MSISLSAGTRGGVNSLQDLNDSIFKTNNRLQTGKKVNSALDNARSYFAAQSYTKESNDLNGLLDGISQARQSIDKAAKAIDGVTKLIQSAQSLARSAAQSTSTTDRQSLRDQIASLLSQAIRLSSDSGFNGKNYLLNDNTTGQTVATNLAGQSATVIAGYTNDVQTSTATTNFTKVTISGVDLRVATTAALGGLELAVAAVGLKTAAAVSDTVTANVAATDWDISAASQTQITTFITNAAAALNSLQTKAATIATLASVLDIRSQFTKDSSRINSQASDNLVLADINEEGANLQSLQTRQSLAVTALQLATRSDQAILRLFG